MKSKDIFCLVIRLVGLIFLYQGLSSVPALISTIWPGAALVPRNIFLTLVMVCWPIAVAFWMVRGAPWLVRLAYSEKDQAA